jgi:nucleotidyltransferase/DNA polymerase involved in DNA repair
MSIPEARAMLSDIDIRTWDDAVIDDAVLAMTTALLAGSPQVTPVAGSPGTWFVGATGFADIGGEEELAQTLLGIARSAHPDARVAIADSCVAARAATWAPKPRNTAAASTTHSHATSHSASGGTHNSGHTDASITIVAVGGCSTYLAPAPLGLVPMDEELREGLTTLGFRTMGALAALEPGDVERRWGAEGLRAWRLSRGDDPRRPGLVRVEAARSAGVELPAPAEGSAPVLFAMRALLERLVRELVEDGRAAASVAITLVLDAGRSWPLDDVQGGTSEDATRHDDVAPSSRTSGARAHASDAAAFDSLLAIPHRTITREVRPARPIARFEPLFDQCRALLERWTIAAPVIGVTLSIPATAPLAADQGDLLIPSWRDAAMNAEAVFARLRTALDPDNVGDVIVHPVQGDSHRPEYAANWQNADAVELAKPESGEKRRRNKVLDKREPSAVAMNGNLPDATPVLRMLDTPELVDVEECAGLPDALWWRGKRFTLTHADGPERLSGDWWHDDNYARDYWRCGAEGEGELLLYHETSRWFLQGWYD